MKWLEPGSWDINYAANVGESKAGTHFLESKAFNEIKNGEAKGVIPMISALVAQLCRDLPNLPPEVITLYKDNPSQAQKSSKLLFEIFSILARQFKRIYVIMNATTEDSNAQQIGLLNFRKWIKIPSPSTANAIILTLTPFLWEVLHTVAASQNKYRKRCRGDASVDSDGNGETEFNDENTNLNTEEVSSNQGSWQKDYPGFSRWPALAMITSISMLLIMKNRATNLLPVALGLFLHIGGADKRIMATLSAAGLSVSYDTTECLKVALSEDATRRAQKHHEQRLNNQNSMIHATNTVVIKIILASDDAFDLPARLALWGNRHQAYKNQGMDILLAKQDDELLEQAFISLIGHLIMQYAPNSKHWKHCDVIWDLMDTMTPRDCPQAPRKTETFPLGVFDVNEGSKKGIIDLLREFQIKSSLSEDEWVKKLRIMELSALWHYALNWTHLIMKAHFGNAVLDPGSLAKHKGLLHRVWDANKPNYAHAKALIQHSLVSRLLAALMQQWKQFHEIVMEIVTSFAATEAKEVGDEWLAHNILFIPDALTFCQFEDAVANADPGWVLRIMKYRALAFRSAGLHNYACECIEVLLLWKYELPAPLKVALEEAWFVNQWGLPGRFIPFDLYLEHCNYWVKEINQCSKECKVDEDIQALVEDMSLNELFVLHLDGHSIVTVKKLKNGEVFTESAIHDILELGAAVLQGGKWMDFLDTTMFDPTLGYPLGADGSSSCPQIPPTGMAFDSS
ncbi:hypothetical protein M422DRAFT_239237 [Sphaerobolus stellatus SS14]|nr:hypothetical protein M422DRAFT_239237 [Sphaerobolus stellatus SS14]